MQEYFPNLKIAIKNSMLLLTAWGETIESRKWQSIDFENSTVEITNLFWTAPIPTSISSMVNEIKPDLPWANTHFDERVGGRPLNPGRSFEQWPYYKGSASEFNDKNFRSEAELNKIFSHTYMERYWPKEAESKGWAKNVISAGGNINKGIRYDYGDLMDVVKLLGNDPTTRQAYLPIFFPEDTGATQNQRIPCTLGYQFLIRNQKLNVTYLMRSCDALRHFRNDIYLTCLLTNWIAKKLSIELGTITVHIGSFHVFKKEINLIKND